MVEIMGRDTRSIRPASPACAVHPQVFPQLPQTGAVHPWTGMRPATPRACPSPAARGGPRNLWLQTGHGALGLTLAFGSAQRLVRRWPRPEARACSGALAQQLAQRLAHFLGHGARQHRARALGQAAARSRPR
jgi:hypothetical protein